MIELNLVGGVVPFDFFDSVVVFFFVLSGVSNGDLLDWGLIVFKWKLLNWDGDKISVCVKFNMFLRDLAFIVLNFDVETDVGVETWVDDGSGREDERAISRTFCDGSFLSVFNVELISRPKFCKTLVAHPEQ